MEGTLLEKIDKVNGRQILGLGPSGCYGWFVEKRGIDCEQGYMPVWFKFPTLEGALEEARRLGPLPDHQETP